MASVYADHTLRFFGSFVHALENHANPDEIRDATARFSSWNELGDLLVLNRLGPYCTYLARDAGIIDAFPETFRDRLIRAFAANNIRSFLWKREMDALFTLLNRRKIPLLVAKGAASFFRNHYVHSAVRVMNDCDVWLPPGASPHFLEDALREREYRLVASSREHKIYRHEKLRLSLEVHFRLVGAFLGRAEAERLDHILWDRSLPLAAEGFPLVRVLSPRDALLFHVYHSFVEHLAWVYESYADFVEFVRLMEFHDGEQLWENVREEACEYALEPFFDAFTGIVELTLGYRMPGRDTPAVSLRTLKRFLDGERTAPNRHPWRKRALILCGFPGSWRVRAKRLRYLVGGDLRTFRERRRNGRSLPEG